MRAVSQIHVILLSLPNRQRVASASAAAALPFPLLQTFLYLDSKRRGLEDLEGEKHVHGVHYSISFNGEGREGRARFKN